MRQIALAIRSLLRSKAYALVTVATLAIAVGSNTAMFGVLYAVLLRAMPYPEADRLLEIGRAAGGKEVDSVTYPAYERWRESARSFQSLAVYFQNTGVSRVTLTFGDEPEAAKAAFVSASFFETMGVAPRIGRVFSQSEERSREPVAVVSDALWQKHFPGADEVGEKVIHINGLAFRVTGVMPAFYAWPSRDAVAWVPITHNREWARRAGPVPFFRVVGRLAPGMSRAGAESEFAALYASADPRDKIAAVPVRPPLAPKQAETLYLLAGAVGFVLLIACANIASLNLARGARRGSEIALRVALGAGRARVAWEMFFESLLLAGAGAAGGLLLASTLLEIIVRLRPVSIERMEEAGLHGGVLLFSVAATLLSAVLAGLLPAWRMSARDPAETLRVRTGGSTGAAGAMRLRRLLLAGELALTVVLLAASGLMLRSLAAAQKVELGFDPSRVLTFRVLFPDATAPERRVEYFRTLFERVRSMPQVEAVGAVNDLFELKAPSALGFRAVDGRTPEPRDAWTPLTWTTVAGSYFESMGTQLVQGRWFLDSDGPTSPSVAVIDENAAHRYWPGENPVGHRFKGQDSRGRNDDWTTVIGVVRNMRRQGLDREPTAHVYEWYRQRAATLPRDVIVRTASPVGGELRAMARAADATVVLSPVRPLVAEIDEQLSARRFDAALLSGFAAIAFALAAVGIYGVVSYSVATRVREFGIRAALGESAAGLRSRVLKEASLLALAGIAPGVFGAWLLSGFVQSLVFGVSPLDPLSLGGACVLLGATAVGAACAPAIRASRVDPLTALREE